MNKLAALRTFGICGGVAVTFLGGCTSLGEPEVRRWTIPQAGSSWTLEENNTGSYGKDVLYEMRRGEAVWQGQPAVTITNSVTGMTLMVNDGKWMAIVGRDGKPVVTTYDPPIGFQYPPKVGGEWVTTHRMTTVATGRTTESPFGCKVDAYQPVTVRAGTFNAFRIACKGSGYEDTYWSSPDYGMNLKRSMRRYADHPQGPGTQEAELVALNLVE